MRAWSPTKSPASKVFGVAVLLRRTCRSHGRLDSENYADAVRRHGLGVDHAEHAEAFQAAYATSLEKVAEGPRRFRGLPGHRPPSRTPGRTRPTIQSRPPHRELGAHRPLQDPGRRPRRRGLPVQRLRRPRPAPRRTGPRRAVDRFEAMHGTPPARVIVIGDTPRDVQCARAGHAESVAVATGVFDTDALRETGADVVVEDSRRPTHCSSF